MSLRKVTRLKLDPKVTSRLVENNILTAQDIMECPVLTLMEIADLSYKEAVALMSTVGEKLIQPHTALEMLQSTGHSQSISCGVLGTFTERVSGGFIKETISEICGPPGVGKTQLCMGSCADVLMVNYKSPRFNNSTTDTIDKGGGVVYYDTELKFSVDRFLEILIARYPSAARCTDEIIRKLSVRQPMTCTDLKNDLIQLESYIVTEGISTVVIDSIAALPRKEGVSRREEENFGLQLASILQTLAESCSCAIIVTNQIIPTNPRNLECDIQLGDMIHDRSGKLKPSLGISWHHRIATRIVLNYTAPDSSSVALQEQYESDENVRIITLEKSPLLPRIKFAYKITIQGVECEQEMP